MKTARRFLIYGIPKSLLLKIILFLLILLLGKNVFAKDVTNYVKYNTDNPAGTYKGDEISLGGYNGKFDVKTRYNGSLSLVEFYLPTNSFEFDSNTTYTITLSMATDDWRNNFMLPQVIKANNDGTLQSTNASLTVSNFQFVSRKTIKFNFKTNSSISPYLFFRLYSTDFASSNTTAITGDSWNLSSIVITDNSSSGSSGSSSSGGSSSGNPSVTCNNGLVLSSKTFDYSNVDISSKYLDSSGQEVSHNSFGILSYVPITGDAIYYLTRNLSTSSTTNYCLYDSTKTLLSCQQYGSTTFFTINTGNARYISLSIRSDYVLTLSTCKSPLDNQNQNTEDIINNQNQNTSNIIENNNYNTQAQIESQKVCKKVEYSISYDNRNQYSTIGYLSMSGSIVNNNGFRTSDYISIFKEDNLKISRNGDQGNGTGYCLYNSDKVILSCSSYGTSLETNINIQQNGYIRFSGSTQLNYSTVITRLIGESCKNGNQAITDSITDDNVDGGTGSDFFNNFSSSDNGGISGIITKPLVLINSLLSNNDSCSNLSFSIQFPGLQSKPVSFPSGCILWNNVPSTVINLYQVFVVGFCSYYLLKRLFKDVEDLKNPEKDEVEVIDL